MNETQRTGDKEALTKTGGEFLGHFHPGYQLKLLSCHSAQNSNSRERVFDSLGWGHMVTPYQMKPRSLGSLLRRWPRRETWPLSALSHDAGLQNWTNILITILYHQAGDGQGGLACCSPWGRKELDKTEQLNWTELKLQNLHEIKI